MKTVNADFDIKQSTGDIPLLRRFLIVWLPHMLVLAVVIWSFYTVQAKSVPYSPAALPQRLWLAFAVLALILTLAAWAIAFYGMHRSWAEESIRASETRFCALLESAPDAIVIVSREGRIALVNAQAEKYFGYTRDELLDQPIEILVPESLRSRHEAHRAGYIATPPYTSDGHRHGTAWPAQGRQRVPAGNQPESAADAARHGRDRHHPRHHVAQRGRTPA